MRVAPCRGARARAGHGRIAAIPRDPVRANVRRVRWSWHAPVRILERCPAREDRRDGAFARSCAAHRPGERRNGPCSAPRRTVLRETAAHGLGLAARVLHAPVARALPVATARAQDRRDQPVPPRRAVRRRLAARGRGCRLSARALRGVHPVDGAARGGEFPLDRDADREAAAWPGRVPRSASRGDLIGAALARAARNRVRRASRRRLEHRVATVMTLPYWGLLGACERLAQKFPRRVPPVPGFA